jgi:hypothetical protein
LLSFLQPQEEIKERFKDIQDDAKLARDELNQLLRQRDEWSELKLTLEQSISDYVQRGEEQSNLLLQKDHELLGKSDEIVELNQNLAVANQRTDDHRHQVSLLEGEIKQLKEAEAAMNESLRKTRAALTKETARVRLYENLAATAPSTSTSTSQPLRRPEPVRMAAPAEVRVDSPYLLQQELMRRTAVDPENRELIDLDDQEAVPAGMRMLVPSVLRQAEIQTVQEGFVDNLER